jgi:hypothetical protein
MYVHSTNLINKGSPLNLLVTSGMAQTVEV